MQLETLDVAEMAALLRKTEATVKKDVSTAPWRLPPRLRIPGSRRVLWLRETTLEWLRQQQEDQPVLPE